jgi:hypothetical protein
MNSDTTQEHVTPRNITSGYEYKAGREDIVCCSKLQDVRIGDRALKLLLTVEISGVQ